MIADYLLKRTPRRPATEESAGEAAPEPSEPEPAAQVEPATEVRAEGQDQPLHVDPPAPPSPPPFAWEARAEIVAPLRFGGGEIALVATSSANGALRPHLRAYLRALREEGIAVLLVASAERTLNIPADVLGLVDGALVREARGQAFAAWSHALRLYPELYDASILYLVDDSMVGPAGGGRFGRLIARVRASAADLVGLTESQQPRWHVQSYFLALKGRLLSSFAIQRVLAEVRLLADPGEAFGAYEVAFAYDVEQSGYTVELLFPNASALDPTGPGWRFLIRDGFPFVRLGMLRAHAGELRPLLDAAGFDPATIEDALHAKGEQVAARDEGRLAMHPVPFDEGLGRPLRVAFHGPWHLAGASGERARATVAALRRSGARVNLLPSGEGIAVAPAAGLVEFTLPADIAVVAASGNSAAVRRVGWVAEGEAVSVDVDLIWTADPDLADRLAADGDVPAEPMPGGSDNGAAVEARLRRLMADAPALAAEPPLTPSLRAGTPFEAVDLGARIRAVALAADGSPSGPLENLGGAEWVAFAPRGALAAPGFAAAVEAAARARPGAAIFYADDLAVDTDEPIDQLRLKPELDLTLLAAQDYVGAPLIVRADALAALGGLDPAMATAAVADLLFRAHAAGFAVARIPEVLLAHSGRRVRADPADYRRMLAAQPRFAGCDIAAGRAPASFAIRRRFAEADAPAVTIVVPTCRTVPPEGGPAYVERLLEAIAEADWPMAKLEVLVGDDVAGEPDWARRPWPFALRRIETPRGLDQPFNFSAKVNRLWREAATEQIVLMNDDVRPLTPGWLKALMTFAVEPEVGAVGARLLDPDGRLQHVATVPHGTGAAHAWGGRRRLSGSYQDWALVQREWSMVTAAVLATRRSLLDAVGGLDESFRLEFNDVDLCLKLRLLGLRIVSNPDAELAHVERASRRDTLPPGSDVARFTTRWRAMLDADPSWHPRLRRDRTALTPMRDPEAWYL